MENKKIEQLNEQELEKISGGYLNDPEHSTGIVAENISDVFQGNCPCCKHSIYHRSDLWLNGKTRDTITCCGCYQTFYINDDGVVVWVKIL